MMKYSDLLKYVVAFDRYIAWIRVEGLARQRGLGEIANGAEER